MKRVPYVVLPVLMLAGLVGGCSQKSEEGENASVEYPAEDAAAMPSAAADDAADAAATAADTADDAAAAAAGADAGAALDAEARRNQGRSKADE